MWEIVVCFAAAFILAGFAACIQLRDHAHRIYKPHTHPSDKN